MTEQATAQGAQQAGNQQQQPLPDEVRRWRGFTHEELYRMLHDGPGAQASADPSRRWAALHAALTEIGQDLGDSLSATGSQWAGRAAGAAYDKLAPLAVWAQAGATEAGAMRLLVENQADEVAKARAEMPAPEDVPAQQPDPATAPALTVVGVQNDAEPVEAARSAGEQKAFEVMAAYEQNTTTNLATAHGFAKPTALAGVETGGHGTRGPGVNLGTGIANFVGNLLTPGHQDQHRPPQHHGGGWHGGGEGTNPAYAGVVDRPRFTPRRPYGPPVGAGGPHGEFSGYLPGQGVPGRGDDDRDRERVVRGGAPSGSANQAGASAQADLPQSGGQGGQGGYQPSGHQGAPVSRPGPHGPGGFTGAGALGGDDFTAAGAASAGSAPGAMNPAGAGAAPVGAGGAGVPADNRMAPRRFGTEALGGSQWFGDAAESVAAGGGDAGGRQTGGRRRDFTAAAAEPEQDFIESHDINGEDVHLPPGVIGG
ncbi:PPE domain-containing protein [Actinokineospora bangkokensis]|uniref:PPE domain-containing protein n=1 Tax=Actinokineospora bangkokensis TaxID=1193682 RepID=A0A1Q9LEL6_9PSEU|nr:PPE domain-containing protein [Actinokineospora bangkokensis]OLR90487.1 hypothetical protein BJP25_28030 [Actinokineospora bangkokensis]